MTITHDKFSAGSSGQGDIFRDRKFILKLTTFSLDPVYPYPMDDVDKSDINQQLEKVVKDALSRKPDVVRLRYLPIEALPEAESLTLPLGGIILKHQSSSVVISGSWSPSLLRKSSRKGLKRNCRSLGDVGSIEFREIREQQERLEACRRMLRWKRDWLNAQLKIGFGFRDSFFQKSLFEVFDTADPSKFRVFGLCVDGTTIAYEFCILKNKRLMSVIASYDKDYARFSPGRILSSRILENSQKLEFEIYDMLPPETDFKRSFANTSEDVLELLIPRTRRGKAMLWLAGKCGLI